ncbi:MAG: PHP domain-containing protein [Betaproteobacteria bacterium]|nr:PHP domain-containing protein [Betaproteobacteria bacterium]
MNFERMAVAAMALAALAGCGDPNAARHELAVPWALGGKQLVADFHTHTKFSDGALELDTLVRQAYAGGCQVLAITDHSNRALKSGTQDYLDAIAAQRKKYPKHLLIAGLEWNVPPHGARVHMGMLFDPATEKHMIAFKERFEKSDALLPAALGWLNGQAKDKTSVALIFNHPSRYGETSEMVVEEWLKWRRASDRMVALEGGPGHQNMEPNGAYKRAPTIERWDPAVAHVGGAWDQLLDRGENAWAALASSDYHNAQGEFTPCEFSRTVVSVPEATASGVLKALHAGSFWAAHGHFLDYLLFTVKAQGLESPAAPGETIRVPKNAPLYVRVAVDRASAVADKPLQVQIIGNCKSGKPEIIQALKLAAGQSEAETTLAAAAAGADGASCYLRARARGENAKGGAALAYLNPIRIRHGATR